MKPSITVTNSAVGSDPRVLTDGRDNTYWSTQYMICASAEIRIDIGFPAFLDTLYLLPEQYEGQNIEHNDRPEAYRLDYSLDGQVYRCLEAQGRIAYGDFNDNSGKFIPLKGIRARYIRLLITGPTGRRSDGQQRISIAAIEVSEKTESQQIQEDDSVIAELQKNIVSGTALSQKNAFYHPRSNLNNSYKKLKNNRPACIAFVGGSITEMNGWRNETISFFKKYFPQNPSLHFIESGIASYDSSCHAFRLEKDVFSQGKVDLMLLEAAVNDEFNGRSATEIQHAMEGIVRQAYRNNPQMDILFLYFADDRKIAEFAKCGYSHIIRTQEHIAEHYQLSSIDLSRHVIEDMNQGRYDWKTFGGLHPAPFGHMIYSNCLTQLLRAFWQAAEQTGIREKEREIPPLLSDRSYCYGRSIDVLQAVQEKRLTLHGFTVTENWNPQDGVTTRADFVNVPMLTGVRPGDGFQFRFRGTALLLFIASGPKSGRIRYRIDDGSWNICNLQTHWSNGLHLPWVHCLRAELENKDHKAELEILENPDYPDKTSCVIRYFLVNEMHTADCF